MATIERIEILEYDHVVAHGYDTDGRHLPRGAATHRTTRRFAVRLHSSDGAQGTYAALWSAPPLAITQVRALASSIVGMDVGDREKFWDRANRSLAKSDRIGVGALDIAWWDLLGRTAGLSVSALLGRYRDRLPAYVSTIGGAQGLGGLATVDSYRDYAAECAERGVPGFKMHGTGTGDARIEAELMTAVAEGSAGRSDIMTDPGNGLATLADALTLGRVCDEVGAYWWEDPMRDDAAFGHKILRERIRTPLLITEFVRGLEQRMAVALAGGTDFLRADPELDMGITGVMKTAHAAESLGIDMEVHASGPAQRHCMAAIRNTNYYELGLLDPMSGNPLHPPVYSCDYAEELDAVGEDGCVQVPDGPGLGVEYDWERLLTMNADRTEIS